MPRFDTRKPVPARLLPALLKMRLLWAGIAGGKIVYLVLGQLVEGHAGNPKLTPMSLRLVITAVAGGGAVLALSSILIRANLRRAAVRESEDIEQYFRRLTFAQVLGLGLCDTWAIGALVLRLLGAGAVIQVMLTVAAVFADFFHYPMTSDLVHDVTMIEHRTGNAEGD